MSASHPYTINQIKQEGWIKAANFPEVMRGLYLEAKQLDTSIIIPNIDTNSSVEYRILLVEELGRLLIDTAGLNQTPLSNLPDNSQLREFSQYIGIRTAAITIMQNGLDYNELTQDALNNLANSESFQDSKDSYETLELLAEEHRPNDEALLSLHAHQGETRPEVIANDGWLHDGNIDHMLSHYNNRSNIRVAQARSLSEVDFSQAKRDFRNNPDINLYMFPINVGNNHWVFAAIIRNNDGFNLVTYNPSGNFGRERTQKLVTELAKNENSLSINVQGRVKDISAPHQQDGFSCGYRTTAICDLFASSPNPLAITSDDVVRHFNNNYPDSSRNTLIGKFSERLINQQIARQPAPSSTATFPEPTQLASAAQTPQPAPQSTPAAQRQAAVQNQLADLQQDIDNLPNASEAELKELEKSLKQKKEALKKFIKADDGSNFGLIIDGTFGIVKKLGATLTAMGNQATVSGQIKALLTGIANGIFTAATEIVSHIIEENKAGDKKADMQKEINGLQREINKVKANTRWEEIQRNFNPDHNVPDTMRTGRPAATLSNSNAQQVVPPQQGIQV